MGDTFTGPNGMSLRPYGPNMHSILTAFKGNIHILIHTYSYIHTYILTHKETEIVKLCVCVCVCVCVCLLSSHPGEPRVYRLHMGLVLPEGLVVLHEHTDHYSMQVRRSVCARVFITIVKE